MRKIQARERLHFVLDVGAAFSPEAENAKQYLLALVNEAFGDAEDADIRAKVIESLTRLSHGREL
jgi:hypothetical protein